MYGLLLYNNINHCSLRMCFKHTCRLLSRLLIGYFYLGMVKYLLSSIYYSFKSVCSLFPFFLNNCLYLFTSIKYIIHDFIFYFHIIYGSLSMALLNQLFLLYLYALNWYQLIPDEKMYFIFYLFLIYFEQLHYLFYPNTLCQFIDRCLLLSLLHYVLPIFIHVFPSLFCIELF